MNALAQGALIDAVRARTARERTKTDVARWLTLNATTERGLPPLPETDSPDLGILYALATGATTGSNGGSQSGGANVANTSQGGAQSAAQSQGASPAPTSDQPTATAGSGGEGQAASGSSRTDAGASNVAPSSAGGGGAGSVGPQGFVIPWGKILAGAALMLGGGGAASIPSIIAWATSGRPEANAPAETSPAEYPLLEWLREHSYHMPPEESSE